MNTAIVVSVDRDRWFWPKLTVRVLASFRSAAKADAFITSYVRSSYDKARKRKNWSKHSSMKIKDIRVVDEQGLQRLEAAAKASVTIRRRRAAQKAAKTRARNAERKEALRLKRMEDSGAFPVPIG